MPNEEEVALNFGDEAEFQSNKKFRHPFAVFFHLLFRSLAVITYLLCGLFSNSFIVSFVFIIFFLSADFWTVKNITGRLLVGLRWWNYIDEEGKSHWIYESRKGASKSLVSNTESRVFWLSMAVVQTIWVLLLFVTLFSLSFKWFMVVLVANSLNGANLYGYIKCKLGADTKLTTAASNYLGQSVLKSMFTSKQDQQNNSAPKQ